MAATGFEAISGSVRNRFCLTAPARVGRILAGGVEESRLIRVRGFDETTGALIAAAPHTPFAVPPDTGNP
jgi:hypothetical protein